MCTHALSKLTFLLCLEYIDELYETLKKSSKEELEAVALQTKEKIIPPMNRMLDRESKADAIEKHNKRKQMITVDVPATGTVSEGYHFKHLNLKLLCGQSIFIIGSGQFRGFWLNVVSQIEQVVSISLFLKVNNFMLVLTVFVSFQQQKTKILEKLKLHQNAESAKCQ